MTIPKDNSQLENARRLRREMTPHERKLWYLFLRKYPVKIYKQRIIGEYIVDFYCHAARLIVELDGSQHYQTTGMLRDQIRTERLEQRNLLVVRIPNNAVNENFEGVCEYLDCLVGERIDR